MRQKLVDFTNQVFEQYDFIISPTVPTTAFKIGMEHPSATAIFLADIYTVYANLVGIPGISLPLYTHSNGMPFGLQVMSASFNESALLQFSNSIMKS